MKVRQIGKWQTNKGSVSHTVQRIKYSIIMATLGRLQKFPFYNRKRVTLKKSFPAKSVFTYWVRRLKLKWLVFKHIYLTFVQHQNVLTSGLDLQSDVLMEVPPPQEFLFLSLINCSFSLSLFFPSPPHMQRVSDSCWKQLKHCQEERCKTIPGAAADVRTQFLPPISQSPVEIPGSSRTKSLWYNSTEPAGATYPPHLPKRTLPVKTEGLMWNMTFSHFESDFLFSFLRLWWKYAIIICLTW